MRPATFVMIGGFLGAGKTTALGRLARHFESQGRKVGLITNDQANNLVDTQNLRAQGFATEEIPGGCFCCRFDALAEAAGKLAQADRPEVFLAEPVGSCTDLVATVVQPLKRLYGAQYQVAPYTVLLDPVRARSILAGEGEPDGGFSPKVVYIFRKQLEEADAIAVNKADTLGAAEREELLALVRRQYPQARVLMISAQTGEGFEDLIELTSTSGPFGRNIPEVDYDVYAEGEAELGWLNCTATLRASEPFEADALLLDLARGIQRLLGQAEVETAHLKMLLRAGGLTGIVNLVRRDARPELSQSSGQRPTEAELVVNARAHTDPAELRQAVEDAVSAVCSQRGIRVGFAAVEHFRPGRPVPTHRYARAV